jgi:two-component system response regulator FixJ
MAFGGSSEGEEMKVRGVMTTIREQHVFVVDDQPTVCEAICETLEQSGDKVTCFACAAECLEQLRSQTCDLLIAELRMPEIDCIELLTGAKRLAPWMPVLVVVDQGDVPTAVEAVKAGATDVAEKPLDRRVLAKKAKSMLREDDSQERLGKPLTKSERRVLRLVIDGKSNTKIATLLNRSRRTIEVHRRNIRRKLDVHSLVALVKRAAAMGLVDSLTNQAPVENE